MKSESSDTRPLLNIKDVLLKITYQTNYTENLLKVGQTLVEYLATKLQGICALYLHDNDDDPIQLNAVSNKQLYHYFKEIVFDPEYISKLLGKENGFFPLSASEDISKKFTGILPLIKGAAYCKALNYEDKYFGVLFITTPTPMSKCLEEDFLVLTNECSKLLYQVRKHLYTTKMGKQYEQLFLVTEKFHSTKDEQEVLDEVLHSLKELYPSSTIRLLFLENRPKDGGKDSAASYAFMTGEIRKAEKSLEHDHFYIPLRGHQGIYGVLEIIVSKGELNRNEIEFIRLLANTAGHALENARLYQQSQQLISDLRLINEASQHLNAHSGFNETADYLINLLQNDFGSDEAAILFSYSNTSWEIIKGSTPFFFKESSQSLITLIRQKTVNTNDAIFRGDVWREYGHHNSEFRSLISIPMHHDNEIIGVAIMLHKNPYHFTFDNFKLANSLIQHSTLALINARLNEELEHMVITDQLTQLYSRHFLNTKIEESFKKDEGGALILIDIDNFKEVNDTYGHPVGDIILKKVSEIMQSNIRDEDIAARWGGEELAIYLPKGSLEIASKIAERLLKRVEQQTSPKVTISCGVSSWTFSRKQSNPDQLFEMADKALYSAKNQGKNRIRLFDRE